MAFSLEQYQLFSNKTKCWRKDMAAGVRNEAERNVAESQYETRLDIFVRSLAEVIRQHPGISEKDLMELYTAPEGLRGKGAFNGQEPAACGVRRGRSVLKVLQPGVCNSLNRKEREISTHPDSPQPGCGSFQTTVFPPLQGDAARWRQSPNCPRSSVGLKDRSAESPQVSLRRMIIGRTTIVVSRGRRNSSPKNSPKRSSIA